MDKILKDAESRIAAMRIAPPAGLESSTKAADEIDAALKVLRVALKDFVDILQRNGYWDDGCFYYYGRSASEFQDSLNRANDLLKK